MPNGKPNIAILWGDDVGWWNISYNSRGQMGYRTPNIDRVGNEGIAFTDYYGQQSCTAGRSSFICGQNPIRTGLTKVGMPGTDLGIHPEDPTIAQMLKPLGYATGQFGKNHLGDRNPYLPTVHGFDEFFGNLYHLNAEEEPEHPEYPTDPAFKERFGPRGVLHCWATDTDDTTEEPRWGKVGKQKVEDTGPLTIERMGTIDDEITEGALGFIEKAHEADTPFFLWFNTTGMHFRTHIAEKTRGKSGGQGDYADRMVEHDENIGKVLDKLDELGIADDTIVLYSTDNGVHFNTWPDAGITPFAHEKNTNWEGAWRVPAFVRWPGHFEAGTVRNGIVTHMDWAVTLLAAAGEPDIKENLLKGCELGDTTFKVHLDGWNMLPYLTGEVPDSPRPFFFYFSDDGEVMAIRFGDWKMTLMEQRAKRLAAWIEPLVPLRTPHVLNLRQDPFERSLENSNTYYDWMMYHAFLIYEMQGIVADQLEEFAQFPPRSKPASFNLKGVMDKLSSASAAHS